MGFWQRLWRRLPLGEDRFIFRYWDGRRQRRADPLEVFRGFFSHPNFDLETDPDLVFAEDLRISLEASARLTTAVRDILQVPPFAEGGLTEAECLRLWQDFFAYTHAVKKNGSGPPTSPDNMGPPSSDRSNRNAATDCCSTAVAPPFAAAGNTMTPSSGPSDKDRPVAPSMPSAMTMTAPN